MGHGVHLYRFAGWVGVRLRKNLTQKHGMYTGEEDVAVCKGYLTVHRNVGCAMITCKMVTNSNILYKEKCDHLNKSLKSFRRVYF